MNTRTHTEPKEATQPTMYYKALGVEDYIFIPDYGDRKEGKDSVRIKAAEPAGWPSNMVWFSLALTALRTYYHPINQSDVPEVWLQAFHKSEVPGAAFKALKQSPEPVLRQIITYDPDV